MKIKPIKLVEPTKAQKEFFKEFVAKHEKGLRAIKALEEIKEMLKAIMETNRVYPLQANLSKVLQKINEVENDNA